VLYCTALLLYCIAQLPASMYCTVLYCTTIVLHRDVLHNICNLLLYCTSRHFVSLHCTVLSAKTLQNYALYCTVLQNYGLFCSVQCCTVLRRFAWCTVLHCAAQCVTHCTVLHCIFLYWPPCNRIWGEFGPPSAATDGDRHVLQVTLNLRQQAWACE